MNHSLKYIYESLFFQVGKKKYGHLEILNSAKLHQNSHHKNSITVQYSCLVFGTHRIET